jgi:hypothetical protein
MITPIAPDEADQYFFTYISKVPAGDIVATLGAQASDTMSMLRSISEQRSLHRYAAGKWSVREVLNHISDTERVFVFRAMWFARGFDSPLPSFDQDRAVATAAADNRSWSGLVSEFESVRAGTLSLFRTLPEDAWLRRGIANDKSFTVRALAHITAGHVAHHVAILREKYL